MNNTFSTVRRLSLVAVLGMAAQVHAGDIVMVMAAGAPPLTKNQVSNIYIGRSNYLKPVDLPESDTRAAFYKKTTDRDESQIKSLWARLGFAGNGRPPKRLADADAVKKAVVADPKAIGYIDRADLDETVKVVLTLD